MVCSSMKSSKQVLSDLNLRPSKAKGQNFLNKQDSLRLVSAADLDLDTEIIEIGPGLGAITEILLEQGYVVRAIEVDEKLIDYLRNKFLKFGDRFSLIQSDFRVVLLNNLVSKKVNVFSNVPYVFSSEMVLWLIRNREYVSKCSLLLQREFSERISGKPKTKQYGSLSVHIQAFAEARMGLVLPGTAFYPPASVESMQLHIDFNRPMRESEGIDVDWFEQVVRASFSMRRKKLISCLSAKGIVDTKEEAIQCLENLGLSLNSRAEELSVKQFIALSEMLKKD